MDNFDESHGLGRVRDPFNSTKDNETKDWSKQRIAIGVATERNLLDLTEYKVLPKELGLYDLFEEARQASKGSNRDITAAQYLIGKLGFERQVKLSPSSALQSESSND